MANFCANCGTKIRKEDNFCTNCGTKLEKEENFCINCGTKLEKEDNFCINCGTKIDKSDMKQNKPTLKTVHDSIEKKRNRIAKEKEEEKKKLEKANKEQKIRIKKEKENRNKKIEKNNIVHGGYCSLKCRHSYEEFIDSGGEIVGDFDSEGYVEYYCRLGHSLSFGRFCEDYE